MASTNFYLDNDDIKFHLTKRLDLNEIYQSLSPESQEASGCANGEEYWQLIDSMLESVGKFCAQEIAPKAVLVEKESISLVNGNVVLPPTVLANVRKLIELGCANLGVNPRFGGVGIPFVLETVAHEIIMRSCPSTGLNVVWYSSIAHVLDHYANEEIKERIIPRIASGEWSGSMALTEPDAGSDLGNLRTYGVKQDDGTWRLYGTKRFISNGASEVCLVLAMNGKGAKGLGNLNLFLCLHHEDGGDNYSVSKIEEKIGLHGSATCELQFDGSKAFLIGQPNQGFHHMLKLMNDARIAVGFQGLGHMEAIVRMTKQYCVERQSWGKSLIQHEMIAEKILDMETDLKASRSLCYQASFLHSMSYLDDARLNREKDLDEKTRKKLGLRRNEARAKVRLWTPLIKWYVAERCVTMAREALQLHGGYGFTKEYRPEFWLRESLILPLYEGTSQIQALMCIKDTLKEVIQHPRRFFEDTLALKVQTLGTTNSLRKQLVKARQIERKAIVAVLLKIAKTNLKLSLAEVKPGELLKMVRALSQDFVKMENVSAALLHAERICEIRALVELAAVLVEDAEVEPTRKPVAQRFLHRQLPRIQMLATEIDGDDASVWGYIKSMEQEFHANEESSVLKKSS